VRAGARAGLDLTGARPRSIDELTESPDLVVTVCDVAHEEMPNLAEDVRLLHWSIPDPARSTTPRAFDQALERITRRIETLAPRVRVRTAIEELGIIQRVDRGGDTRRAGGSE